MSSPLARLGIPPLQLDWQRLLPFLRWRDRVNKQSLRDDLIAGITGALVVLPQGVAFATIAGMPPEYGLYAGMIPAIIAALFGSSWHLVSGPTTAASIGCHWGRFPFNRFPFNRIAVPFRGRDRALAESCAL